MLGPTVIALVAARGGSRGFPRKNLSRLDGRTLVEIAVTTALSVSAIDTCVVSSEDYEILDNGAAAGATVHARSQMAASDEATASDVLADFFASRRAAELAADPTIVYLQPTSPLRTSRHIREALDLVSESTESMCVALTNKPIYAEKLVSLDTDGRVTAPGSEALTTVNRQALGQARFVPNGALYIFRYSDYLRANAFPIDGALPYWMDEVASLDIDSEETLVLARTLLWRL